MNFDGDDSLNYDEFGNYIGSISTEPEYSHPQHQDHYPHDETISLAPTSMIPISDTRIVLHEDKKYYLTASETFGRDVEVTVQDEDTQPLTEPIIAPIKIKRFQLVEPVVPKFRFADDNFLKLLMSTPERIRTVAVVGHLHHGKTSLMDMLVEQGLLDSPKAKIQSSSLGPTAKNSYDPETGVGGRSKRRTDDLTRYTDSLFIEHERGISLKAKCITIPLPDSRGRTFLWNMIDTPGHLDFLDEVVAGVRLSDQVILVVDVVEGVMPQTEIILTHLLNGSKPIILLLNKIERLLVELKLPPMDAYHKLKHTIDTLNTKAGRILFSPEEGNVIFASTLYGICFSLQSFTEIYFERSTNKSFDPKQLSIRLWGDITFDQGKFYKNQSGKKTFVTFILEPLYKIFTQVLGEEASTLKKTISALGIKLNKNDYNLDVKPLLKRILKQFFGEPSALLDSLIKQNGHLETSLAQTKDSQELLAFVSKMYPTGDGKSFDALARIYSGTIQQGQMIVITNGDEVSKGRITNVYLSGAGRYRLEQFNSIGPGNLVLLSGLDTFISKTATLTSKTPFNLAPMAIINQPAFKVSIEPVQPTDLPKMLSGLQLLNHSYPSLITRVEDSGEHVLTGTGELYLDCVLHDLRRLFAEIDLKVADPVVRFNETVVETSYCKCFADTPNKRNRLTMIVEPLEEDVATLIEQGIIDGTDQAASKLLDAGWDKLAIKSLWALGPDPIFGPNVFINDTLPYETDQLALESVKEAIIQGFQWACREGPLAEEPMRNVKFRLVDALIAEDVTLRTTGQLVPTVRRLCYSAFLTASPRLMEPMLTCFIQCPKNFIEIAIGLLAKRRGHIIQQEPISGTPLHMLRALLPVLDSSGIETDIRIASLGSTSYQSLFSHWQVVPGDPLDSRIKLVTLEPSPAPMLARDCVLKTRRRKGLGEDVSVSKFFDEAMKEELLLEGEVERMSI